VGTRAARGEVMLAQQQVARSMQIGRNSRRKRRLVALLEVALKLADTAQLAEALRHVVAEGFEAGRRAGESDAWADA
jgi:hypothetical protein